jgi:hypothetical protein
MKNADPEDNMALNQIFIKKRSIFDNFTHQNRTSHLIQSIQKTK